MLQYNTEISILQNFAVQDGFRTFVCVVNPKYCQDPTESRTSDRQRDGSVDTTSTNARLYNTYIPTHKHIIYIAHRKSTNGKSQKFHSDGAGFSRERLAKRSKLNLVQRYIVRGSNEKRQCDNKILLHYNNNNNMCL